MDFSLFFFNRWTTSGVKDKKIQLIGYYQSNTFTVLCWLSVFEHNVLQQDMSAMYVLAKWQNLATECDYCCFCSCFSKDITANKRAHKSNNINNEWQTLLAHTHTLHSFTFYVQTFTSNDMHLNVCDACMCKSVFQASTRVLYTNNVSEHTHRIHHADIISKHWTRNITDS